MITVNRAALSSRLLAPQIWANNKKSVRLQTAVFAYHSGDYSLALREFMKLEDRLYETQDWGCYIECSVFSLRLLIETCDNSSLEKTESRLLFFEKENHQSIAGKNKISSGTWSYCHYILGMCQLYRWEQHDLAMHRFYLAIQAAANCQGNDRSALAWPLYGAACVLFQRNRYDDALKELEKLHELLSCYHLTEIQVSALLLTAAIYRNQNKFEEALKTAWLAFDCLKTQPHLGLYTYNLAVIGSIYSRQNDLARASIYLDLAKKSIKSDQFLRLSRFVEKELKSIKHIKEDSKYSAIHDLCLEAKTKTLHSQNGYEVCFEDQIILFEILQALIKSAIQNPGDPVEKTDLVQKVWKETYSAKTHDNKIYVNIKRLRQILNLNSKEQEYILRNKKGYFLNPKLKVNLM